MRIDRYTPDRKAEWDAFVRASKNGTFLFERDYMDYHADRFTDHSLMFHDAKGRLLSVLPAHTIEGMLSRVLVSHDGLTYGGFVTHCTMGGGLMLDLFDALIVYMRIERFDRLLYKTIPHIYQSTPAEEDLYALWRCGAEVVRSGVIAALPSKRLSVQERRHRGRNDLLIDVRQSEDFGPFWALLRELLATRYGTKPVHTLEEIQRLHDRFPRSIRLYEARLGSEVVAGTVIYDSKMVARAQYIAGSDKGKDLHALDVLFDELLNNEFAHVPWFDMGTSDEDEGRTLNRGLLEWKESWGARAIAHNHYVLELRGVE